MREDRWDALFGDAEGEFAALRRAEMASEAADRGRREFALVRLVDRLRGGVGVDVEVWLEAESVRGVVNHVGPDWMTLGTALIPLAAVTAVAGLPGRTAVLGVGGAVDAKLDLRYALRQLARDRTRVQVLLRGGRTTSGTVSRVGKDFVELAEHPGATRTIPLEALLVVRTG